MKKYEEVTLTEEFKAWDEYGSKYVEEVAELGLSDGNEGILKPIMMTEKTAKGYQTKYKLYDFQASNVLDKDSKVIYDGKTRASIETVRQLMNSDMFQKMLKREGLSGIEELFSAEQLLDHFFHSLYVSAQSFFFSHT